VADDKELDLMEIIHNPLKQPDRAFMALAGAAMPVLLDRVGGFATFTIEEFEAVERRYGGKVSVRMTRTKDGVFKAQLVPGKLKQERTQA
jgi:hypothetical protein